MKWRNETDHQQLSRLLVVYGTDALVLELARFAEQGGGDDPAERHIAHRYAGDIRRAQRRRDEARSLVSYRRDWPTDGWIEWLESEAEREGWIMRSQFTEALTRAGCSEAGHVSDNYCVRRGEREIAEQGGRLPSTEEQWIGYVRAREAQLDQAASAADLVAWLTCVGYPVEGTPDALDFLARHRERLPRRVQRYIPARPKPEPESPSAPSGPPPDPEDTSMFEAPEGD